MRVLIRLVRFLVVGERALKRSQSFKKGVFSHRSGPWACD